MNQRKAQRSRHKGYYFLTPVWGEEYTRLFIEIAIPSLLAPGNLPEFKGDPDSWFIIFTTPQDAKTICAAPIFQQLSAIIPVNIEYILKINGDIKYNLVADCHRRGLAMADAVDAAILFINPDLVFADGSLRTVKRLAEEGKDLILVTGIRTIKETVPQALQKYIVRDHSLIISPRNLMKIAMDNLHPLAQASWWEEGADDNLIPANLYWRAGKEGILARCFHLHTILMHPQRKNAVFFSSHDDDLIVSACPNTSHQHIITDSDDFLIIEMTEKERMFTMGCHKGSVKNVVDWAEFGANDHHRQFLNATIRIHTGIQDSKAWQEAEQRSNETVTVIQKQLSRPAWQLLLSGQQALMMRSIHLSRYYELFEANGILGQETALLDIKRSLAQTRTLMKYANILTKVPAKLLAIYSRLARRAAIVLWKVKQKIYGQPWQPRPWIFQYRYIKQIIRDLVNSLEACKGTALVISRDDAVSLAAHCYGLVKFGVFAMEGTDKIQIIDKGISIPVKTASYDTIVIERSLPKMQSLAPVIREISRILKPSGRLILFLNRIPARGEYVEEEICTSTAVIANLLRPGFNVMAQRTQGTFTQSIVFRVLDRLKWQRKRIWIPFVGRVGIFLITLPITLPLAVMVNVLLLFAHPFDTSRQYYISSITLAEKKAAVS